jgi:hypothetical protein
MADFDGFEFIITEEDDIMLIIYARSTNPENPEVELNKEQKRVILRRNSTDVVTLEGVEDKIMENLSQEKALLIAEVVPTDNPLEHEVKQVYNAVIKN